MNIKAIETIYNGIRFRSRLEARWAIFMDALGVKWEYEPEGFTDGTLCYLPDFWLPDLECYLEIKPTTPSEEEIKKAWIAVMATEKNLAFIVGRPADPLYIFSDWAPEISSNDHFAMVLNPFSHPHVFPDLYWSKCDLCGHTAILCHGRHNINCCWERSGIWPGKHNNSELPNAVYQANNYRFGGHT